MSTAETINKSTMKRCKTVKQKSHTNLLPRIYCEIHHQVILASLVTEKQLSMEPDQRITARSIVLFECLEKMMR